MPAAAVIPAPIAYIKVVAVKKLVVDSLGGVTVQIIWYCGLLSSLDLAWMPLIWCLGDVQRLL